MLYIKSDREEKDKKEAKIELRIYLYIVIYKKRQIIE